MTRRTTWIVGGALTAVVAAAAGVGTGAAQAAPSANIAPAAPVETAAPADPPENDVPIPGDALAQASAAALASAGGGTVTETEVGDEEGYYEVEITRADGSQLDVHLDERFTVLGSVADNESEGR